MSKDARFNDFILTTLNVQEKNCVDDEVIQNGGGGGGGSPVDHVDGGIGLLSLFGGGDIDDERRGNGILHEAAKSGTCCDLEQFLSEMNVDAPNSIGETALHLAAEFEHGRDVAILLRAGANIQVRTNQESI